ncbi:unnamed protein product [Soboliphyme baturini]|uniref:TPR_REGION domain-containing protein n=1 Tax=Soboliphyme baturini TaxID=241478 RepID=A0A183IMD5_9BILA|nr:unnamed protein product [Soboliphyme baturini]
MSLNQELDVLWNAVCAFPSSLLSWLQSCTDVGQVRRGVDEGLSGEYGPNGEPMLDWFHCGICCLDCFVRLNFVGPVGDVPWLPAFSIDEAFDRSIIDGDLSCDSDSAFDLCRRPFLLLFAKWILVDKFNLLSSRFRTSIWWAIRTLWIWQKLFEDVKVPLRKATLEVLENESRVCELLQSLPTELQSCFWTELSYVYSFWYDQKSASEALSRSLNLCGVEIRTKGVLGLRTKFQSKQVAQLTLDIKSSTTVQHIRPNKENELVPLNLSLDDDTLLSEVKYLSNGLDSSQASVYLQLILLARFNDIRKFNPKTYLLLLRQPKNYVIQFMALYFRCQLESVRRRKVERALKQMEELINGFSAEEPPFQSRSVFMYSVNLPPIWTQKRLLADLLFVLGCTREAMENYHRLNDWENTVKCYKAMGMLEKAEDLIRDQLRLRQTPLLLCYLGDVTSNPACYEQAWQLSGNRFARAGQFEQAVVAFQKSLELQPLQMKAWYHMGYCALQLKDYASAANAYQHCTSIEPDNFEAWNNLAASYVELKQYERAFMILNEALKHDYENWKVWDNFVLVAVSSNHLQEAIDGIHRLLDLHGKYTDYKVLGCFVRPDDDHLWRLYAELCDPESDGSSENNTESLEKYLHLRQKAYHMSMRQNSWVENETGLRTVINDVTKLAEAQLKLADRVEESKAKQLKNNARLNLNTVLKRIHGDVQSKLPDDLQQSLLRLEVVQRVS